MNRYSKTGILILVFIAVFVYHAFACIGLRPIADIADSTKRDGVGIEVVFDGIGSYDLDGTIEDYVWDADGGTIDSGQGTDTLTCTFDSAGTYNVTLVVVDDDSNYSSNDAICVVTAVDAVFICQDASDNDMAIFGDAGNLFLKGTMTAGPAPTAGGNDEFRVQDSSSVDVAIIDCTNGNMYIDGTVYENQETLSPSSGDDNFIIEDSSGNVVAYINDSGDLYLKGTLYESVL